MKKSTSYGTAVAGGLVKRDRVGPRNLESLIKAKDASYWNRVAKRQALNLFHHTAERVPAYKDFLARHGIKHSEVRTLGDFTKLPAVSKENYVRKYPPTERIWNGNLKEAFTIYATSGTTGEPTYFYRDLQSDFKREIIVDTFLKQNTLTTGSRTLFIVAFGMGVWSAGIGIYTGAYLASKLNGYPISIISPGVDQEEVLKILKNIAPDFKQVIIAGYPPFTKNVIDEAIRQGIPIKNRNLRFIFTGEAFTEPYRDYISQKSHVSNPLLDTMNVYGTSELGTIAFETPLSILIRRIVDKPIFKDLFGNISKTPTLGQYIPYFTHIDSQDGELYFTGDASMPFIRYASGDHGGLLSYDKIREIFADHGVDLEKECRKRGISNFISKLPFVYVYERKNLATTLYGILIYPEYLKPVLLDKNLNRFLTGKFTMMQKYDRKHKQYLEINLELKPGVHRRREYEKMILDKIVFGMRAQSSEFKELTDALGTAVYPHLVFWPYGDRTHFSSDSKQNWMKN